MWAGLQAGQGHKGAGSRERGGAYYVTSVGPQWGPPTPNAPPHSQFPPLPLAPPRPALTLRVVAEREERHAGRARTGAENGDTPGVPAEGARVLAHPAQRLDLVQEPVVASRSRVARAQEPCGAGSQGSHRVMGGHTRSQGGLTGSQGVTQGRQGQCWVSVRSRGSCRTLWGSQGHRRVNLGSQHASDGHASLCFNKFAYSAFVCNNRNEPQRICIDLHAIVGCAPARGGRGPVVGGNHSGLRGVARPVGRVWISVARAS